MNTRTRNLVLAVTTSIVVLSGVYLSLLFVYSLPPNVDDVSGQDQRDEAVHALSPREELARYESWAQYPPDSRLLNESAVDLIDPYNAELPAETVLRRAPGDCEETEDGRLINCQEPPTESGVFCTFVPERTISTGLREMKVFLRCYRQSRLRGSANLPLRSIAPRVYWRPLGDRERIFPPVTHGDEGRNGDAEADDYLYTFVVGHGREHWGWMDLEVSFEVEGLRHFQGCTWFSTPQIVAEFQTTMTDNIDDGHLVVSVPVEVNKQGYYEFDANLQEKDGNRRFVASSTWKGELTEGLQTIRFRFWGKIIRDTGADGPYVVREIRGRRKNSDITPAMMERAARYEPEKVLELVRSELVSLKERPEPLFEYLEPVVEPHITADYDADEFSDEVWDSAAKNRRIRLLQSLIERGESAEAAGPGPR